RRRAASPRRSIRRPRIHHQAGRFRSAERATAAAAIRCLMSELVPAKILAVDDEADFEVLLRQRFRHQIRAREFDFRFACHGEEALSKLADEPDIELLLLDINMPVMDGLTLLAELRTRQSPARAIIVSAYGDMANIRTAMNRGAFDFVTKPVDLNDLEITIKKTLDEIGRIRELDRQRAAAERARANLSRYFSPNLATLPADRVVPGGLRPRAQCRPRRRGRCRQRAWPVLHRHRRHGQHRQPPAGVDAQPRYAARRWRRARRGDRRRLIGRGGAPRTVAGPRQSGIARPQRACPHLDPPPAQLSKLR